MTEKAKAKSDEFSYEDVDLQSNTQASDGDFCPDCEVCEECRQDGTCEYAVEIYTKDNGSDVWKNSGVRIPVDSDYPCSCDLEVNLTAKRYTGDAGPGDDKVYAIVYIKSPGEKTQNPIHPGITIDNATNVGMLKAKVVTP